MKRASAGSSNSPTAASCFSVNPHSFAQHNRRGGLLGMGLFELLGRGKHRDGLALGAGVQAQPTSGHSTTTCAICLSVDVGIVQFSSTAPMTDPATLLGSDVQSRRPSTHVSLSRVGVTGIEKVIRIRSNGDEQLYYAEL